MSSFRDISNVFFCNLDQKHWHVQLLDDWYILDSWYFDFSDKTESEQVEEIENFIEDVLVRPYGYIHLEVDEVTFYSDSPDDDSTLFSIKYDHSR